MPTTVDTEVQRLVRAEIEREEAARVERIRQRVLEEQAARQAEQAHQQRIAELRERIPVELDRAELEAAEAKLAEALDGYVAVCGAYDRRFGACWHEINNLAATGRPMPADLVASHIYGGMISIDGRDIRKARLHATLVRLADAAMRTHRPPDHVDLTRAPQD